MHTLAHLCSLQTHKENCTLIKPFSRGFNTEIAMRKAKENVEKHYAVVGVLEELNKTLTVLEHYVPRFFKGAKDVYWSKCIISGLRKLLSLHLFFLLLPIHKPLRNLSLYCFRHLSLSLIAATQSSLVSIVPDEVQIFSRINRNIYKPPVAEVGSQSFQCRHQDIYSDARFTRNSVLCFLVISSDRVKNFISFEINTNFRSGNQRHSEKELHTGAGVL